MQYYTKEQLEMLSHLFTSYEKFVHYFRQDFPSIMAEMERLWALEDSFKSKSKKINHQRKILFVSQLGVCHYCQKKVEYHYFNVDHKLAKVNGGTDDENNLVGACLDCNLEKAGQDYETFKQKKLAHTSY